MLSAGRNRMLVSPSLCLLAAWYVLPGRVVAQVPPLPPLPPDAGPPAIATDREPVPTVTPTPVPHVAAQPAAAEPVTSPPPRPRAAAPPLPERAAPPLPPATPASSTMATPPRPVAPPDSLTTRIETARFKNVQPGTSRRSDVEKAWGAPIEIAGSDEQSTLIYATERFRRIEMNLAGDRLASILVHLDEPLPPEVFAARTKLAHLRGVEVPDEQGRPLGRVFPERGVLLSYQPGDQPLVAKMLIEPVSAQPFVLRARSPLHGPYADNLADLEQAIRLEPRHADAHWLRAEILLATGRVELARQSAVLAVQFDPDRADYHLTLGRCLGAQRSYAEAIEATRKGLRGEDVPPLAKARGLVQWGRLLADGPLHDTRRSVKLYMSAIEAASALTGDLNHDIRRSAKEVTIDAHLSVARDIGWGPWEQQAEVVPRWIESAKAMARKMVANDGGSPELELRIAEQALHACSGFESPFDPAPWVDEARDLAEQLVDLEEDEQWKARIDRQLGRVYLYALQIEHSRGNSMSGLQYGREAQALLVPLHSADPDDAQGRDHLVHLFFGMGALHAVHNKNHESAVVWYQKCEPLIRKHASDAPSEPGRLGEMMVSMGVTYWATESQRKAVELTEEGVALIEGAVAEGLYDKRALTIPYGNLSSMYRELGDVEKSADFAKLAEKSTHTIK